MLLVALLGYSFLFSHLLVPFTIFMHFFPLFPLLFYSHFPPFLFPLPYLSSLLLFSPPLSNFSPCPCVRRRKLEER
jgi:hypothetical protein